MDSAGALPLHLPHVSGNTRKDPSGSLHHQQEAELGICLAKQLLGRGIRSILSMPPYRAQVWVHIGKEIPTAGGHHHRADAHGRKPGVPSGGLPPHHYRGGAEAQAGRPKATRRRHCGEHTDVRPVCTHGGPKVPSAWAPPPDSNCGCVPGVGGRRRH